MTSINGPSQIIHWIIITVFTLTQVFGQTVVEGFDGGSATLPCTLTPTGDLSWKQGTTSIIIKTASGQVIIGKGPYEGNVSLVNGDDLKINPLMRIRDGNTGAADKIFECADTGTGGGTEQIKLRLLAPITGVSITEAIGGTVTVTAGTSKTLICSVSGEPNPPPSYSWNVDGTVSTETSKSINFEANKSMKFIKCTATNKYTDGRVLGEEETTVTLNVQYLESPKTSQSNYTVIENDQVTLQCSAEGNPQPTYQWERSGSSEVISTSADYTIQNVERSAAGPYSCSATNSVGSYETFVQLIIQYPPDITVTYDETTQTLTCRAEGVPNSYSYSQWEHRLDGKLLQTLETQSSGSTGTLNLPGKLTYEDTGDYVCQVSNGIKSTQRGQTFVTPQTGPIFEDKKSIELSLGKKDTISIPFYTYSDTPIVKVVWEKSGKSSELTSHREETGRVRLMIHGQSVSIGGTVTILTLRNVTQSDEGNYTVTVTNNINGESKSNQISLSVSVSLITDAESDSNIGVIVGGVVGAIVLIVLIIVLIFFIRRRSAKPSDTVGKEENGSVNEQLVGNPGAFSDDRWKQPDAEIAVNDLYESASFSRNLPPQDQRPPKPQRSFTHKVKPDLVPIPSGRSQDIEMFNKSADNKAVKNGAPKKKRGNGKPAKPLPPIVMPIDDTYGYEPTSFGGQNNNRSAEKPDLNYQQVDFDKKAGKPKVHPRESPVDYADISFVPEK